MTIKQTFHPYCKFSSASSSDSIVLRRISTSEIDRIEDYVKKHMTQISTLKLNYSSKNRTTERDQYQVKINNIQTEQDINLKKQKS